LHLLNNSGHFTSNQETTDSHFPARRVVQFADLDIWIENLPTQLDYVFQVDLVH